MDNLAESSNSPPEGSCDQRKPHVYSRDDLHRRLEEYRSFKKPFFINVENIVTLIEHLAANSQNGKVGVGLLTLGAVVLARENWHPSTPDQARTLVLSYLEYLESRKEFRHLSGVLSNAARNAEADPKK